MFISPSLSYRGTAKLLRLGLMATGNSVPGPVLGKQVARMVLVPLNRQFSDLSRHPPKPLGGSISEALLASRIKSAYKHVGGGIAITAASAAALYNLGLPAIMANAGTGLSICVSLAATIPLLWGTLRTDYHLNPQKKKALWAGFLVANSATLSVLGFAGPTILLQAGAATGLMMGGLSIGGMYTDPAATTHYRAPLGAALGVVVAASIGQVFWPLPILHTVSLYGGLLVFSAFTVTDTQVLIQRASAAGPFDPINASLSLYLDTINIFVRVLEIAGRFSRNSNS